jgi:hypothetical protein
VLLEGEVAVSVVTVEKDDLRLAAPADNMAVAVVADPLIGEVEVEVELEAVKSDIPLPV